MLPSHRPPGARLASAARPPACARGAADAESLQVELHHSKARERAGEAKLTACAHEGGRAAVDGAGIEVVKARPADPMWAPLSLSA